ncbi:MAG TPA: hypothetical protein GX708_09860 [Gallicola sp.]|nr:hypothetical protein [Gallicola sp.]
MRVLVQKRDLMILNLAKEKLIEQSDIPWESSYQSKMRRLRKLCEAGFLEMLVVSRQRPNQYRLTEKGERVLRMKQNLFNVKH